MRREGGSFSLCLPCLNSPLSPHLYAFRRYHPRNSLTQTPSLSHSYRLSLSLSPSLSLSLVYLSSSRTYNHLMIWASSGLSSNMHRWSWSRRCRSSWGQLRLLWNAVVGGGGGAWRTAAETVFKSQSLATFDRGSRSQQVLLNLFNIIVPSVCEESAQIVNTLFCVKWQNFDCWFEPTRALFWCIDLESILMARNTFQWHRICLCLESFVKSHFFETDCQKYQFNLASFCLQDQLELKIGNWDYFQTRFNATNPMTVSYLVNEFPLKIIFFEISPIV